MKKKLSITIHSDCYLLALIPDIIGKHNSGKRQSSIGGLAAHLYYVSFHNRDIGIRTETPEPHRLLIFEKDVLVMEVFERSVFDLVTDTVPTLFTQKIVEV